MTFKDKNIFHIMEEVLFGDPFQYHIQCDLGPRELYLLRYVNKYFNRTIKTDLIRKSIKNIIRFRLEEMFGDYTEKFLDLLDKEKGIICGTFITQCILGEYWDTTIDIYLADYNVMVNEYWRNNNNTRPVSVKHFIVELFDDWKQKSRRDKPVLKFNENISANKFNIDTFAIKEKNTQCLIEYLDQNYYSDFCKNYYSRDILSISDLFGNMNKVGVLNITHDVFKSMNMYNIYKSNGFIFTNPNKISCYDLAECSNINNLVSNKNKWWALPYHAKEITLVHKDDMNYAKACVKDKRFVKKCDDDICVLKFCNVNVDHQHYYRRDQNDKSTSKYSPEWIYINTNNPN